MHLKKNGGKLDPMLENLSKRARFRQWLQAVASGEVSDYPEPDDLPRDARIMLESEDSVRRELRQMRSDIGVLRNRLAELAEGDAARDDEELVRQLANRLREARRASVNEQLGQLTSSNELQQAVEDKQAELDEARDRIAQLQAELQQAQAATEREQAKLLPVVRYAYRLRRLIQAIFNQDQLTDEHRAQIVDLLKAGGVPVDSDRKKVTHN